MDTKRNDDQTRKPKEGEEFKFSLRKVNSERAIWLNKNLNITIEVYHSQNIIEKESNQRKPVGVVSQPTT